MLKVIKRNGDVAEFDLKRISDAIMKAFVATDVQYTNDIVDLLSLRVTADFQEKVKDEEVHVEDVQDSVERVLEQAGYSQVAKAYILYRKQLCKGRGLACQGKFHRNIFCRRTDLKQFRRSNCQLLAFRDL